MINEWDIFLSFIDNILQFKTNDKMINDNNDKMIKLKLLYWSDTIVRYDIL